MGVSQQFINLLNLTKPQLLEICDKLDVAVAPGELKYEIVRKLSMQRAADLGPLAADWIYAGQASASYLDLQTGPLDRDVILRVVTDMCGGQDPLNSDIRPDELTTRPELVEVSESEGKIFLAFGIKRPLAQYINNFAVETLHGDDFFTAVIRLNDGVIEIRANIERAKRLTNTWLSDFIDRLEEASTPSS